jgi:hypothetical protein
VPGGDHSPPPGTAPFDPGFSAGSINNEDVPDTPITQVIVDMQGGKKGLVVNSQNLCAKTNRANVQTCTHTCSAKPLTSHLGLTSTFTVNPRIQRQNFSQSLAFSQFQRMA